MSHIGHRHSLYPRALSALFRVGSVYLAESPLQGWPELPVGGIVARTATSKITLQRIKVSDTQRRPVTYQESKRCPDALRNNSRNMREMVLVNNEPRELF